MEMWSVDCKMDEAQPDSELMRIPILHSKYLNILTRNSLVCKKLVFDYSEKKNLMSEYYSGSLNNPDDLKKYGFEPFLKTTNTKAEVQKFVDADKSLIEILMKKAIHEEIVNFCTAVLKELHSRTFQLRSYIDYKRYLLEK